MTEPKDTRNPFGAPITGFKTRPPEMNRTLSAVTCADASSTLFSTISTEKPGVDVNLARLLANDVESAVLDGTPEQMARVRAAYEALHGMDDTVTLRRIAVVRAVQTAIDSTDGTAELSRVLWAADEAYMKVPLRKTRWLALARTAQAEGKTEGGPGNLSAIGVTAHLSVECGAFGEYDLDRAKKHFRDAMATVGK